MSTQPTEHLGLLPKHLGKYFLTCGSPARAAQIASYLDDAVLVGNPRKMDCFVGSLEDERVTVVTHGMGCPSIAIALLELIELSRINKQRLTGMRVGTAGSLQSEIIVGDLTIVQAAVRDEHTTDSYVPKEFPAFADFSVTQALLQAAQKLGVRHHMGVVHTKDDLNRELMTGNVPLVAENQAYMQMLRKARVASSSMESAALFIIAWLNGVRAGTVLTNVGGGDEPFAEQRPSPQKAIEVAIEALRILIRQDQTA
ncbi:MAG: nucleoside phosphorylase [Patescibacteria group bacterium]